ncbi:UDP-glucose flavonoid 3-O-glucosyltransferase 7-like [Impatiens glandulifera]|uniref:UDP-glucose flavonoid 3-O-glucosyltransferase 7-like n=1 Tax=Impatiens glandulifera TaxID=253017 RepID=UPI001FB17BAF|nr:UDP-glucose flavonoid 3-O-glucosyltransferase 7-like [Impatiens glandulifera]
MASSSSDFHVMFIPYMAPGHMIPMLDIAGLFAENGVRVTIITTPNNADRYINHKIFRPLITLKLFPFPTLQAGLPKHCENITDAPTPAMSIRFLRAVDMLRPEIETFIRQTKPQCIFSDVLFPWTSQIAIELGIPRLSFCGSGFFNLAVSLAIQRFKPHENVESDSTKFVVPTLPHRVLLTRSQLPDIMKSRTTFSQLFDQLNEAESKCYGMVVNSFQELESGYGDYYRKTIGIKAWHVGPTSLYKGTPPTSSEKYECLTWLDGKEQNSVLYICFGSLTRLCKTQIDEIATALEDSKHSFIWVLTKILKTGEEEEEEQNGGDEWWLPNGFEKRMNEKQKGIIIKGWAPQISILSHPATGGFLTHCGWNSILEGVAAGVPFVTWPIMADQFSNEQLLTQVLKIGIPVGNEVWRIWATEETPLIDREMIKKAMVKVMDGGDGEEAMEMRNKVAMMSELAKKAVEKDGSSIKEFNDLIQDIKSYKP